ncbi:DUF6510 family protein, partial [Acinetobacter baumannii]
MQAVDGNAVGGALSEYFGEDMTAAAGACGHCGAEAVIAELVVYCRAPGAVVRCRTCGDVVMVIVDARGRLTVDH